MYPCCRWSTITLGTLVVALAGLVLALLPGGTQTVAADANREGLAPALVRGAGKPDWTMFGGSPSRNMVASAAKGLPVEWSVDEGKEKNIRWKAAVGSRAYAQPVTSGGKVYVATNNARPRDPNVKGERAVLLCFNEADGKFLWQATHEMPPDKIVFNAKEDGLCSTPTIDGDRLYYLTPACQLVCADAATGKEVWKLDMMKELKVYPCFIASGAPLVVGDLVFAVTGNGRDARTSDLVSPEAPSFVAVSRKDGKVKWQSNLPGKNVIEGQWGSPAYAEVNGQRQVIFPGGDCYLYSFEPETGKLLWKFYCNSAKEAAVAKKIDKLSNYLVATPVVADNRLYVGIGMYPENPAGGKVGHFWCVDLVKATQQASKNKDLDVSPRDDNFDPRAKENESSALAWHYGGELMPRPKFGRTVFFGRTASTAAVEGGLVYITEEAGFLHCLDALTGKKYWDHDLNSSVWGSPLWADNKVYVANDNGSVFVFAHGKDKKLLAENDVETATQAPPTAANGTLYVLTKTTLFAIRAK